MEDKEKIINRVDVSQCEFYVYYSSDRYPHRCGIHKDMFGMPACCDVADCCKDCYFKQLKRKEQTLNSILELTEENKNTCQYQGICKSILEIINEAKRTVNNAR